MGGAGSLSRVSLYEPPRLACLCYYSVFGLGAEKTDANVVLTRAVCLAVSCTRACVATTKLCPSSTEDAARGGGGHMRFLCANYAERKRLVDCVQRFVLLSLFNLPEFTTHLFFARSLVPACHKLIRKVSRV